MGTHSFREEARTRSSERKSVKVMESLGASAGALPFSRVVRASFRLSSVFCISAVCKQDSLPVRPACVDSKAYTLRLPESPVYECAMYE